MKVQFFWAIALGFCVAACTKENDSGSQPDAVAPSAAPAIGTQEPAYVIAVEGLRREPVTDAKVPDKANKAKKDVYNILTVLQRGETVTVLEYKDAWAHVRAADESEGWLRREALVSSTSATVATVLEEVGTYDRPQLVSINPKRKIAAGTLLFALRAKEQFSEVDLGGRTAWVKTDNLQTDGTEVEVAKLLAKAAWMEKKDAAAAAEIRSAVRTQFGSSRLVATLDKPGEPIPAEPQDAGATAQPAPSQP